jgi:predicted nucleotide-binding protein
MARRPAQQPPQSPVLTPDQIRRCIERMKQSIEELQAFDPQKVQKRYNITEVVALEASIADALASAFGHGTHRYELFKGAANLDQGPRSVGPLVYYGDDPMPDDEGQEPQRARQYLAEGKERSIQLLQRAIRTLEVEIDSEAPSLVRESHRLPANKVFVVHGHDEAAVQSVARFLEQLRLEVIILREQPDAGRTIIQKFEDCAGDVGFAVVLLTPDDLAGPAASPTAASRARQNVIFELGYFAGKLGRGRACLLRKGEIEIPSDLYAVIYTDMDAADGWKIKLVRELKAAKLEFDASRWP